MEHLENFDFMLDSLIVTKDGHFCAHFSLSKLFVELLVSFLFLFYIKYSYYIYFFWSWWKFSHKSHIFFKGLCERNNHNILLSICFNFQWTSFLLILYFCTSISFFSHPMIWNNKSFNLYQPFIYSTTSLNLKLILLVLSNCWYTRM